MDKRIRKNEICIIGLPRCDFVFSSTRSCFIGYGFEESPLEMSIISAQLIKRGIQPIEAGGSIEPGKYAFCAKICSKIIISQFCIVLINNQIIDNREIPNANVNMEYGLMLGFNKHIIPFQRAIQSLPFNVAGLDTIKYKDADLERLAGEAIEQALIITKQDIPQQISPDQVLAAFLLSKKSLITPIISDGEKVMYHLGAPLGFILLNDFSGFNHIYLGNFTADSPNIIIWRLKMLNEILEGRGSTLEKRLEAGMISEKQFPFIDKAFRQLQIWIIVNSDNDKNEILRLLEAILLSFKTEIFSLEDVKSELNKLSS
jgi:hypothetical protein